LFDGYIANMQKNRHENDVYIGFIVVADKKTPVECRAYVNSLQGANYKGFYLDLEWQKNFLLPFGSLDKLLPYNSMQRRNLGLLFAYREGYEILIHLDDDNFSTEDDWVKHFSLVGGVYSGWEVSSNTSWYNVCDLLKFEPSRRIYPRGYPHSKRWIEEKHVWQESNPKRVVVNAGLWLESPDVDGLTHCDGPVESLGFKEKDQKQIALARGTYCPFNTQNTALHRDTLPTMYCIVMGKKIAGICVERYDDIWMSYFTKKTADHLNDLIVFGRPFSAHKRNSHNFINDMRGEADGIVLTNKLIDSLEQVQLEAGNYADCYRELALRLNEIIQGGKAYSQPEKEYFRDLFDGINIWLNVCKELG